MHDLTAYRTVIDVPAGGSFCCSVLLSLARCFSAGSGAVLACHDEGLVWSAYFDHLWSIPIIPPIARTMRRARIVLSGPGAQS